MQILAQFISVHRNNLDNACYFYSLSKEHIDLKQIDRIVI